MPISIKISIIIGHANGLPFSKQVRSAWNKWKETRQGWMHASHDESLANNQQAHALHTCAVTADHVISVTVYRACTMLIVNGHHHHCNMHRSIAQYYLPPLCTIPIFPLLNRRIFHLLVVMIISTVHYNACIPHACALNFLLCSFLQS